MDYQLKSYSQSNKKKFSSVFFILVPFGIWIAFMYWSMFLGQSVVLFEWFPQWTISVIFAAVVGVIGGIWSIWRRSIKQVFKSFLWSGFFGLVLIALYSGEERPEILLYTDTEEREEVSFRRKALVLKGGNYNHPLCGWL